MTSVQLAPPFWSQGALLRAFHFHCQLHFYSLIYHTERKQKLNKPKEREKKNCSGLGARKKKINFLSSYTSRTHMFFCLHSILSHHLTNTMCASHMRTVAYVNKCKDRYAIEFIKETKRGLFEIFDANVM